MEEESEEDEEEEELKEEEGEREEGGGRRRNRRMRRRNQPVLPLWLGSQTSGGLRVVPTTVQISRQSARMHRD